jgi:hypothetical protein
LAPPDEVEYAPPVQLSLAELRLCFVRCAMHVGDEMANREKACSLEFEGFVEALSRLAHAAHLPQRAQVAAQMSALGITGVTPWQVGVGGRLGCWCRWRVSEQHSARHQRRVVQWCSGAVRSVRCSRCAGRRAGGAWAGVVAGAWGG